MNQCAGNGIEQAEDAQGDGYEVDNHRQRDIELDAAHNGVGKAFEVRQTAEVFFVLFKLTPQRYAERRNQPLHISTHLWYILFISAN